VMQQCKSCVTVSVNLMVINTKIFHSRSEALMSLSLFLLLIAELLSSFPPVLITISPLCHRGLLVSIKRAKTLFEIAFFVNFPYFERKNKLFRL
jgi:hypothetical protein